MALKLKGATEAARPPRDTHFDLREKNGVITLRATTHDGKRFLLADVTPNGLKMRPRNNHPDLGVRVDRNGAVTVS